MHDYLIQMLACPSCRGDLAWTIDERRQDRIEAAEARCTACDATYPIREGIGLFLTPDLPRDDMWELADSRLLRYLRDHPEIERQLLDVPLDTLAPADQFFRAMVLEERGEYAGVKAAEQSADEGLYTPEVRTCRDSQTGYVLERLSRGDSPIVDLASGRCYLVERMAHTLERPIVATDFSPGVLRRDRRWLEFLGLYDRVSLLAFDARRTPFKDGAVETLTTNQGLPNIEAPGELLRELRRIVAGTFLAIHHFYPEDDEVNAAALREVGLAALLFRRPALARFIEAGWRVEAANVRAGRALPTPTGVVLEGAGIDGFPVAETVLEWCVLIAR
jgi:uncharacterized protein YbaR (Trm112 family)